MGNSEKKTNILLTDDHKVIRDGIKFILKNHGEYNIFEASSAKESLFSLHENKIDVLITDISMKGMNGDELTKIVLEKFPTIKIIVLTMHDEKSFIEKLLNIGVHGYILKDCGGEEIISAIESVKNDGFYFSQSASQKLMMKHTKVFKENEIEVELSEREKDILKLISKELTNKEVGDQLCISPRTVESHRRNLMQKIGAKNMIGLVKYAYSKGFLNDVDEAI